MVRVSLAVADRGRRLNDHLDQRCRSTRRVQKEIGGLRFREERGPVVAIRGTNQDIIEGRVADEVLPWRVPRRSEATRAARWQGPRPISGRAGDLVQRRVATMGDVTEDQQDRHLRADDSLSVSRGNSYLY
jgi:hypothetical protein